ncbi:hypothetical protein [Flexithrix dorotheae]|uniref:hypothetical protein n=1 Tax=Flexithrix dorotheae TaxID=70993 RepID=UPI0003701E6B|nr:hypothetical protein [Flexithrix dorotheae]
MGNILQNYLILIFLLFWGSFAQGQVFQKEYKEWEIEDKNGEDYKVITAKEKGVAVILANTSFQKNSKRSLDVTFLDTSLEKVWEKSYLVDNTLDFIDYQYIKENIYILFEKPSNKYHVLRINVNDGSNEIITYEEVKNFYVTDFSVLDSVLFLGGMVKDSPAVIMYNYKTGNSVVTPSINQLKAYIVGMQVDEEYGVVSVVLKSKNRSNDHSVYIATYDLEGKLIFNFPLERSLDYNFLTFRPMVTAEDEMMVLGTYALNSDDKTQGVYALKTKDSHLEYLRFYDFGYFKNFFNYLEEKRYDRMMAKIVKKRENDKIYPLRFDVFVHNLKVVNDQIVFSGDIYEPINESSNSSLSYFNGYYTGWRDPYFRQVSTEGKGFDGEFVPAAMILDPIPKNQPISYGFTHVNSFACGFNKDGVMLWDNTFSDEDIEVDYPIEISNVYADYDSAVFLQVEEDLMRYKISGLKEFTDSVTVDSIAYLRPEEKSSYFDNGGVIDWYGPNFLASGIRKIKHKFNNDLTREVFFLQKIVYIPRKKTAVEGN